MTSSSSCSLEVNKINFSQPIQMSRRTMSEAGLPDRPARRHLTDQERTAYINQITASLLSVQLPLEFGNGDNNNFMRVQVSFIFGTSRQPSWAFTCRVEETPPPATIPPSIPPSTLAIAGPAGPSNTSVFDCTLCCIKTKFYHQRVRCGRCEQMICRVCAKKLTNPKCPFCRFRNWDWPDPQDDDLAELSD